jgi:hypothetical protein
MDIELERKRAEYLLRFNECDLLGSAEWSDGRIIGDSTCRRIAWLVEHQLREVAVCSDPNIGAWETLYIDPGDGRFWVKTYPWGALQGGGTPRLTHLSDSEAAMRFELPVTDRPPERG